VVENRKVIFFTNILFGGLVNLFGSDLIRQNADHSDTLKNRAPEKDLRSKDFLGRGKTTKQSWRFNLLNCL
jgi:hypothetical protein